MSVQSQIKHDIHTRLEQMSAARLVWEEGTMRAATTELYAILEEVYALYAELKTEVSKRRAFAALLTDLDIKAPWMSPSLENLHCWIWQSLKRA